MIAITVCCASVPAYGLVRSKRSARRYPTKRNGDSVGFSVEGKQQRGEPAEVA